MSKIMGPSADRSNNSRHPQKPGNRFSGLAAICIGMLWSSDTLARSPGQPELELARCITVAADGKPWLERTLWGLRDQEGGWIGAEVRNTNGSHDLGPLQVNSWWVSKLSAATGRPASHIRWWLRNDACFNVSAARWIFLSGLAVTGDYWKAVGVYHSPTDWRQRRYAWQVAAKLRRRYGSNVFSPSS